MLVFIQNESNFGKCTVDSCYSGWWFYQIAVNPEFVNAEL